MNGGPIRPCIKATDLRSTHKKNHAAGTANKTPGKIRRRARAVVKFMAAPLCRSSFAQMPTHAGMTVYYFVARVSLLRRVCLAQSRPDEVDIQARKHRQGYDRSEEQTSE